jgi:hypothetical protein
MASAPTVFALMGIYRLAQRPVAKAAGFFWGSVRSVSSAVLGAASRLTQRLDASLASLVTGIAENLVNDDFGSSLSAAIACEMCRARRRRDTRRRCMLRTTPEGHRRLHACLRRTRKRVARVCEMMSMKGGGDRCECAECPEFLRVVGRR